MNNNSDPLKSQQEIYLNEKRFEEPKEVHKFVASLMAPTEKGKATHMLDVGCATGEFIYYLKNRFPEWGSFTGLEISDDMVANAKTMVEGAEFLKHDISHSISALERKFNMIHCMGVMPFFDDLELPILNLLKMAENRASILIGLMCTNHPIDVIMKYRRSEGAEGTWELGWNQFSRETIERILRSLPYDLSWSWHVFDLPFSISERIDDPMRTWTIETEFKPYQTINGARQLVDTTVLNIQINEIFD